MARGFLTYSSALVLQAVAIGHQYGFEVMDVTGLPSGTVYPALRKLERNKLVKASWEKYKDAFRQARPARRYYVVTGAGMTALSEMVQRFKGLDRILGARAQS